MFNPFTLIYLIVPLAVGILSGHLLRKRKLPKLDKVSLAVIVVLIFSLGFSIGSNDQVLSSLPKVGLQALTISIMAILFSIVFVKAGNKMVKAQ